MRASTEMCEGNFVIDLINLLVYFDQVMLAIVL